jgi:hypothetical protein
MGAEGLNTLRREELFRILRRGSEKGALRTPRRGIEDARKRH